MAKKTAQSKQVYNEMAAHYDESKEGVYTRAHKQELIKEVILHDGDTLVDVACGNGDLLNELAKKARVTAIGLDLSENMIAIAKKRVPHCTFLISNSTPLPFADKSVDVITVSCAFHHFENPQFFAQECQRILKDKGTLLMAEPHFTFLIRWIANHLVFPFSSSGDVRVYDGQELQNIFKKAGFTHVQSQIKKTVLLFKASK